MLFQRRRRPRPAPPDTGVVAPPAVPGQPQRDTTHPCPLTATRPVHLGHRAWWAQPWAPPRARERGAGTRARGPGRRPWCWAEVSVPMAVWYHRSDTEPSASDRSVVCPPPLRQPPRFSVMHSMECSPPDFCGTVDPHMHLSPVEVNRTVRPKNWNALQSQRFGLTAPCLPADHSPTRSIYSFLMASNHF